MEGGLSHAPEAPEGPRFTYEECKLGLVLSGVLG